MHEIYTLKYALEEAGIPPRFWKASVKDFPKIDADKCFDKLFNSRWNSLYFEGGWGRGKTHYACALAIEYLKRFRRKHGVRRILSVRYISLGEIILRVRDSFNRKDASEHELLSEFERYKFLIIDDMGQERQSVFTRNALFNLCNYRVDHKLPTIYITIKSYGEMANNLFSFEIMSRIYHNVYKFGGIDRRMDEEEIIEVR